MGIGLAIKRINGDIKIMQISKVLPAWAKHLKDDSMVSRFDAGSILGIHFSNVTTFFKSRNIKKCTHRSKVYYYFSDIKAAIEEESKKA